MHGSNPGYRTIQEAINPLLHESDLALFLFYSRIGKYTRQEFEQATAAQKKFFVFFKTGFEADLDSLELYKELLEFKKSLNDTVLYEQYRDMAEFKALLYPQLNQYLLEEYPTGETAVADTPSPELSMLIRLLAEKEEQIKELKALPTPLTAGEADNRLQKLTEEKEAIQKELQQSEELRQQQAEEKEGLERQLARQTEQDNLKAKALAEIEKGNYAEAETYLKESAKEKISDVASTFFELAKIKKLQLQYAEAFEYYELAVKINPGNSVYLNNAGLMADDLGYYDKAMGYYEKSLAIEINENGEKHPRIAIRYNNIGLTYYRKGEYDKAIAYCKKAMVLDKKFYGEEHPRVAKRNNNLGLAYASKGEYDKVIGYYEKALALSKKFYSEKHPGIASSYNNLGLAYDSKGEYDKAITYYEEALMLDKKLYGEEHPKIAIRYNNFGLTYHNKGEYDKAIAYFEKALSIFQNFLPANHPHIQTVQKNLAIAVTGLDKKNEEPL